LNASPIIAGDILWQPSTPLMEQSNLAEYMRWLAHERGLEFHR
jgi:hypothetical protein